MKTRSPLLDLWRYILELHCAGKQSHRRACKALLLEPGNGEVEEPRQIKSDEDAPIELVLWVRGGPQLALQHTRARAHMGLQGPTRSDTLK